MSTDLVHLNPILLDIPQEVQEWAYGSSEDGLPIAHITGGSYPQWYANLWRLLTRNASNFETMASASRQYGQEKNAQHLAVVQEHETLRLHCKFFYDEYAAGKATQAKISDERYRKLQVEIANSGNNTNLWLAELVKKDKKMHTLALAQAQDFAVANIQGLRIDFSTLQTEQLGFNLSVERWASMLNTRLADEAAAQIAANALAARKRVKDKAEQEKKRVADKAFASTQRAADNAIIQQNFQEHQLELTDLRKEMANIRQNFAAELVAKAKELKAAGLPDDALSVMEAVEGSLGTRVSSHLPPADNISGASSVHEMDMDEDQAGSVMEETPSEYQARMHGAKDNRNDMAGGTGGGSRPPNPTAAAPNPGDDDSSSDEEEFFDPDNYHPQMPKAAKKKMYKDWLEDLLFRRAQKEQEQLKRRRKRETVVERYVLKKPTMQAPPKFKGQKTENFTSWISQLEDYLEYSEGSFVDDNQRIIWVSGLFQEKALQWHQDRRQAFRETAEIDTWAHYKFALKARFTDPFEHEEADKKMLSLKYQDDIADFLARIKELNIHVKLSGIAWRQRIKAALPREICDRLSTYLVPVTDDEDFLSRVLNTGKAHENHLAENRHRRGDDRHQASSSSNAPTRNKNVDKGKKRDFASRGNPMPSSYSAPSSNRDSRRDKPREPRKEFSQTANHEPIYTSLEEATRGIPPSLVEKRQRDGVCMRCGMNHHHWRFCRKQANTSSEKPGKIASAKRRREADVGTERTLVTATQARKFRKVSSLSLSRAAAALDLNPAPPVATRQVAAATIPIQLFQSEPSEQDYHYDGDEDMVDFT